MESLQNDLEELETKIYHRYEEMAIDVQNEKVRVNTNYGELTTATDQQGEVWHREVTAIVNQWKYDIDEMKNKHPAVLNKNTDEITHSNAEIKQVILDLKSTLKSNNTSLTSNYKSRNAEFRRLPPKVQVISPSLSSPTINREKREMFGSLSPFSITTEELGYIMKPQQAVSSPPVKLLDELQLTATIDTGTASGDLLVTMHSNDETQSKIVRYSGSTETQTIQFDDQGRPLYSSGDYSKYLSENRNLDICVTDIEAKAVVVVNHQGHILTVVNALIHILDQDGQFLGHIENCGLGRPWGLCVDMRGNLFVAEWNTTKVKKIQYL
ncbi:uncharacterized protein LOC130049690 [Ostrea edulis]|uniref:uncharacterized protein LOC130049690 n=1 Tax=Ostrea edulis TaxID=37623 RepID=UPI0024AFC609|nr:uncharacterized protein LOC130049690 [Ostrea edulis]